MLADGWRWCCRSRLIDQTGRGSRSNLAGFLVLLFTIFLKPEDGHQMARGRGIHSKLF